MLKFDVSFGGFPSQYLFTEVDLLHRFERAAKAGFKGVEFSFPYKWPKEQLAEEAKKYNLEVVGFVAPGGTDFKAGGFGLTASPDRIGEFQESIGLAIEYAKTLNCSNVVCHPGVDRPDIPMAKTRKTLVENYRWAATALEKEDIRLLVEPINTQDCPGFLISRTQDALQIMDEVNHPNIWLLYDTWHMQIMEGNLTKTITDNIARIAHIQVADNPGRHEPGTGEINFTNLLRFIDEAGYKGWIGCEYHPVGKTEDSLRWMKPFLQS
ncbi:hydroxypyruvate isomerase family protein [Chloroflexota bacterium]